MIIKNLEGDRIASFKRRIIQALWNKTDRKKILVKQTKLYNLPKFIFELLYIVGILLIIASLIIPYGVLYYHNVYWLDPKNMDNPFNFITDYELGLQLNQLLPWLSLVGLIGIILIFIGIMLRKL